MCADLHPEFQGWVMCIPISTLELKGGVMCVPISTFELKGRVMCIPISALELQGGVMFIPISKELGITHTSVCVPHAAECIGEWARG